MTGISLVKELKTVSLRHQVKGSCFEIASQICGNNMRKAYSYPESIKAVKEIVCEALNLTFKDIESTSRKMHIIKARHIAMYECNRMALGSLKMIGKEFGNNFDHSTVIRACNSVENQKSVNGNYRHLIEKIQVKTNLI
jgi:chromosomal replication initiation ATPase DnaA